MRADLLRGQISPIAQQVAQAAVQRGGLGTEEAQAHPVAGQQAYVLWLQCPVQHPAGMGLRQGIGCVERNLEERRQLGGSVIEQVGDRATARVHQQGSFGGADEGRRQHRPLWVQLQPVVTLQALAGSG